MKKGVSKVMYYSRKKQPTVAVKEQLALTFSNERARKSKTFSIALDEKVLRYGRTPFD